jgi:hypothetical protein
MLLISNQTHIFDWGVGLDLRTYSLRFKIKVTFGHNLRFKTNGTFGEISFKFCQMSWNVARNNVNVVVDELPSQSTNNLHLFNN